MKRQVYFNLLAVFFGLFLSFCLIEVASRLMDLDSAAAWLGRNVVGHPELPLDFNQGSSKPNLIYELRPNHQARLSAHPKEPNYKLFDFKINSLGFRGPEFNPKKKEGQLRIFFMGASNTFGFVMDEDTYPAQTQKILNKRKPGRYEIINGGVPGYVISQMSAATENVIKNYEPDIIFFQRTNLGKRAFYFKDTEYAQRFKINPEIFRENLPHIFTGWESFTDYHYMLIDHLASYRLITGLLIYIRYRLPCDLKHFDTDGASLAKFSRCMFNSGLRELVFPYGNYVGERDSQALFKNYPHIPFIDFGISAGENCNLTTDPKLPNHRFYNFCNQPPEPEYKDVHPPSYVYTWYANQLADLIIKLDTENQLRK